jgi:hypothetical protein
MEGEGHSSPELDSDEEGTDSDSEFEWPSAVFDRGRAMQAEIEDIEERQNVTTDWVTEV